MQRRCRLWGSTQLKLNNVDIALRSNPKQRKISAQICRQITLSLEIFKGAFNIGIGRVGVFCLRPVGLIRR